MRSYPAKENIIGLAVSKTNRQTTILLFYYRDYPIHMIIGNDSRGDKA